MISLVADVGGTNSRVGLAQGAQVARDSIRRYRNRDHSGLPEILADYLQQCPDSRPTHACVAMAGPVRQGTGELTNLGWRLSPSQLRAVSGAQSAHVINDLSAQGHGLDQAQLRPLLNGPAQPDPSQTRLVIGIGTGFNAAPVFPIQGGFLVPPSEAGHVSLPVWDPRSAALAEKLKARHGFASVEELLSGRGLPQCHALMSGQAAPADPSDILRRGVADPNSAEGQSLALIIGALGRVAGDLALTYLPVGGIILIGGMARAYAPLLERFGFLQAMGDKGRFSELSTSFPLFLLEDDFAALDGCAAFIQRISQRR